MDNTNLDNVDEVVWENEEDDKIKDIIEENNNVYRGGLNKKNKNTAKKSRKSKKSKKSRKSKKSKKSRKSRKSRK